MRVRQREVESESSDVCGQMVPGPETLRRLGVQDEGTCRCETGGRQWRRAWGEGQQGRQRLGHEGSASASGGEADCVAAEDASLQEVQGGEEEEAEQLAPRACSGGGAPEAEPIERGGLCCGKAAALARVSRMFVAAVEPSALARLRLTVVGSSALPWSCTSEHQPARPHARVCHSAREPQRPHTHRRSSASATDADAPVFCAHGRVQSSDLDLVLHGASALLGSSFGASLGSAPSHAAGEHTNTHTHTHTHTGETAEARASASGSTAHGACVAALAATLAACARQEGQGLRFWAVERARVAVVGFEDKASGVRGDITGRACMCLGGGVCMWRVV